MTENTIKNFIKLSRDIDDAGNLTDAGQIVAHIGTTKTFNVTVTTKTAAHRYNGSGSGNGYVIDGVEAPHIELLPDVTYRFDQSDSSNSGHPLLFYYEADKTTQYTTGVVTNGTPGSAGAYTEISVTDSTPSALYYQCSAHAYMGNAVSTPPSKNLTVGGNITSNGNITSSSTVSGATVTSSGDIKASSFNGGQLGGRRNLIINGAMEVNQRGAAGSPTNSSGYQIIDRYYVGGSGYTIDKSTDVPSNTGLEHSLSHVRPNHTSGSVSQFVELPATGKAGVFWNGNTVTVSCYVKGVSGDSFSTTLRFSTGSGGTDGSNWSSVTGANLTLDGTWQKYENTINVDQSVGGSDTAVRFILSYSNGAVGNETLVTGLQLEVGDTATPFEHRSYAEELALCQRYYQKYSVADATSVFFSGVAVTRSQVRASIRAYGGLMRDEPSISVPTTVNVNGNGASVAVISVTASSSEGGGHAFNFNVATNAINSNHVYYITGQEDGGAFELDAEL